MRKGKKKRIPNFVGRKVEIPGHTPPLHGIVTGQELVLTMVLHDGMSIHVNATQVVVVDPSSEHQ